MATRTATVNVGGRNYVERVLVRYRYRAYPTPGQAQLLARTFGWFSLTFAVSLISLMHPNPATNDATAKMGHRWCLT